jgi:hypothetical protein
LVCREFNCYVILGVGESDALHDLPVYCRSKNARPEALSMEVEVFRRLKQVSHVLLCFVFLARLETLDLARSHARRDDLALLTP